MNTTSAADHGIHNLLDIPPETVASLDPRRPVERWVALWNTPDPEPCRTLIHSLWAPTGEHVLDPSLAMRQAAQQIGFAAPLLEIRGYAALEARVARAHAEFVTPGEYVFRARDNAARVRNVVKFTGRWSRPRPTRWPASGWRCWCWTMPVGSSSTTSSWSPERPDDGHQDVYARRAHR
jgi:hypothetical protein